MVLAACPIPEPTLTLLAAATAGRRRARPESPHARRGWLRVSRRLATGMTPREVAHVEGTDEAAVQGLLALDEFRGLVAAHEALLARPGAEQTARLVRLARMALEMALFDGDAGAALFVLREDARGRDPAETVARGVIASARRRPTPTPSSDDVAAASAARPSPTRPRPNSTPGTRLIARGAARLRRAMIGEVAVRHEASAAVAAAALSGAEATAAAAREALALVAAARRQPCRARPPRAPNPGAAGPLPSEPPARLLAGHPRRPRAP